MTAPRTAAAAAAAVADETKHDEENANHHHFPSSFPRGGDVSKDERGAKILFPWLRSYGLRRKLSFAAGLGTFVVVGAVASTVVAGGNGHLSGLFGGGDANDPCPRTRSLPRTPHPDWRRWPPPVGRST